eukprot:CAMPEP_0206623186 /NCGR_PEP_ID=MMETSP0325_2-20121206/63289_1 /ASSEMBLY_ACC=CAM_ASM_000347 /TAXON_ID=2866 /ORGANISM="Crypthecodinium cohnii, Strain Seligo" /LENGTH=79 /DNA_ID=CAMNT_0054146729 /DNA_START=1 /DNA_END=84 /DNA_ORIENTATION=+
MTSNYTTTCSSTSEALQLSPPSWQCTWLFFSAAGHQIGAQAQLNRRALSLELHDDLLLNLRGFAVVAALVAVHLVVLLG